MLRLGGRFSRGGAGGGEERKGFRGLGGLEMCLGGHIPMFSRFD